MKKGLIYTVILIFFMLVIYVQEVQSAGSLQMIPDEAIRLRILANSDSDEDQRIKRAVRDEVNSYITNLVQYVDDIDVGREIIEASIPELEKIVADTLEFEGIEREYTIEYGENIVFPMKIYDEYVYPAGEYEAILITIGEGDGSNWWCVLFPPLCFLDFSNGSTIAEEEDEVEEIALAEDEVEVKFFLLEWLGL